MYDLALDCKKRNEETVVQPHGVQFTCNGKQIYMLIFYKDTLAFEQNCLQLLLILLENQMQYLLIISGDISCFEKSYVSAFNTL